MFWQRSRAVGLAAIMSAFMFLVLWAVEPENIDKVLSYGGQGACMPCFLVGYCLLTGFIGILYTFGGVLGIAMAWCFDSPRTKRALVIIGGFFSALMLLVGPWVFGFFWVVTVANLISVGCAVFYLSRKPIK